MGAKKKSLANRLAKMSDEERARYLQHKADMEEEVRRRKEQLIATFIKNKIRKEDAFSRLNLAKINQHWHQILRKAKCKEMKENVEFMKQGIERVLALKNRTINNLMKELEQAEQQYSYNFQSHLFHVHEIIDEHQVYIDKLQEEYDKEREDMLLCAKQERKKFLENSYENQQFLKMTIYGNQQRTQAIMKLQRETYIEKYNDMLSTYQIHLDNMTSNRTAVCCAIWKQIAAVLTRYVQQTDQRRMHMAELKRLDAESAAEIVNNQEIITRGENQLATLEQKYESLVETNEEKEKQTKSKLENRKKKCLISKQQLQKELSQDDKNLKHLTTLSKNTIRKLNAILEKGRQILTLIQICRKYETEEEKVMRWKRGYSSLGINDEISTLTDEASPKDVENVQGLSLTISDKNILTKFNANDVELVAGTEKLEGTKDEEDSSDPFKNKENIATNLKSEPPYEYLSRDMEALYNLEGFWNCLSRVQVHCAELKQEKTVLLEENKRMKGLMRRILETAALEGNGIQPKTFSETVLQTRSIVSAPPKCNF